MAFNAIVQNDRERPGSFGCGLSEAAASVWAKHDRSTDEWMPLWRHLADAGAVAGLLWDRWLPSQVKQVIVESLPGGLDDARRLAVWLAATHDIGKATPAFACQVESLADVMRSAGLDMPLHSQMPDRKLAPHGLAGQVLLRDWLVERYGWKRSATHQFTVIAGGHHGVPPSYENIQDLDAHPNLLRTSACAALWQQVQWEILDRCAEACGVADRLPEWAAVKLSQPAQVLLTGLVIVADWIASDADLFPYSPEAWGRSEQERVEGAWRALGLPSPWRAREFTGKPEQLIFSRFRLPDGARVRPVQERAVEVAQAMSRPGLMMIEAPMGEGKTEAALAVAEVFAARSGAGGIFVGLPTMATSSAMFPRMLQWLERVPGDQADALVRSVQLAHSKAALNEDYARLAHAGLRQIVSVDVDGCADDHRPQADRAVNSAAMVAHQWLRGRKKGMLASFVVGTIDQLLFMGLKSRHLALRHLALAGKVVIIDEAHAYDTYMNSYLDRVLSWLGAYRVPVIVLSATLPAGRRRELAQAYAGNTEPSSAYARIEAARGYPLLTAVEPDRPHEPATVAASGRRADVHVERLDDDLTVLGHRLAEELAGGGCALVVRNTVDRVLETAAFLRDRFGADKVTVAHARFVDLDRAAKDADLLDRFGPPETSEGRRPAGPHIVVASQVAEQSLDIDFDLLVSDLCPVDLLLQRMGRTHRHRRGESQSDRPLRLRVARCLVTGADWTTVPVEPVAGSVSVYRRHALLRSAAVLEPYLSGTADTGQVVRLPEDISALVQAAYGAEEVGPPQWQEALDQARRQQDLHHADQRKRALDFQIAADGRPGRPLFGWLEAGVGDAEDTRKGRAQVRDSRESLEVLVVQRRQDGTLVTLPHLANGQGGLELSVDSAPDPKLARVVAGCGLRLPFAFTFPKVLDQAIEELEKDYIAAWQSKECHWLAGELILVLDENCRRRLAGFDLRYTPADGLELARAQ